MITRTKLMAALASALSLLGLLGCGETNHLQSITLSSNGTSVSGGFINLQGEGGTLQLKATGNYSSTKTHDLTNVVTYTVTPVGTDDLGVPLPNPPQTVQFSPTGLVTAVEPFVCSWEDLSSDPTAPSWFLAGSYKITVTFQGITSQPLYVAIASSAGTDPNGACGPS